MAIANGLRANMGLQKITIKGVSPRTHFAKVMVEADYRMKLIGIGLERPPVRMNLYVDRVSPAELAANAMQRWWFTPDYEAIRESEDHLAIELEGESVRLVGEQELVDNLGNRKRTGKQGRGSELFTRDFTEKYAEIAKNATIYAELRNVIDLAIAAAYIEHRDWRDKTNWSMQYFENEDICSVERHLKAVSVPTVANAIWRGRTLMTPVGGGVSIKPSLALKSVKLLSDTDKRLEASYKSASDSPHAGESWWWD
jgi:hypothetical protein